VHVSVDDLAISTRSGKSGLDHLGIQVETQDELHEVFDRLQQADRPALEEGATTCCYAKSEKSWIADPQGLSWETFLTSGESTVYGDSTTETLQGVCCAPKEPKAS
jgi:predicted 3-demethylubiquinone-9 3-methyltransferase (glyoxalase superfamily)